MPNHVMNRLTFHADQARVDQILDEIAYTEQSRVSVKCPWGPGTFDFSTVIPMPEDVAQRTLKDPLVEPPAGELDWYHWSLINWGTKWNSYEGKRTGPNSISFGTAWSHVSQKYPDVKIEYAYWDMSDYGASVGTSIWENGCCVRESFPKSFSREALELLFAIEGKSAADFNMRFDEAMQDYVWVDDDEANGPPTSICPECKAVVGHDVIADCGRCSNCGFVEQEQASELGLPTWI